MFRRVLILLLILVCIVFLATIKWISSVTIPQKTIETETSPPIIVNETIVVNETSEVAVSIKKVQNKRQSPDDFQAGIAVLVYGNDQNFTVKTQKLLDHLVNLGVNSLTLVFPIFQENWRTSEVYLDEKLTPSKERLATFIRESHKRGFTIMLRPLLDETSFIPDEQWRGSIKPRDKVAWFQNYTSLILEYAKLAQGENVEIFNIGTEFTSLEKETEQWRELVSEVRKIFSGQITYSSNWDSYHQNVSFWEELDFISIDAYFPLDAPNEATIEQLITAWQPWVKQMEKFRALSGKEIILTELGTRSQLGSFRKPYVWYATGVPVDLETQRKYYEASWLATKDLVNGIYWWAIALELPKDPCNDSGFNPLGKSAEQEIKKWYRNNTQN